MAFSIQPGVWPVMITPFTEDNKPDFKAIEGLCNWYIKKGCTGIFAVCQSSEMAFLTEQEKLDIAKAVVDAVAAVIILDNYLAWRRNHPDEPRADV